MRPSPEVVVERCTDARALLERARAFLEREEHINTMVLGNALAEAMGTRPDRCRYFLGMSGAEPVIAAMWQPPYALASTRAPHDALGPLAEAVCADSESEQPDAVFAPVPTALALAERLRDRRGGTLQLRSGYSMELQVLERVAPIRQPSGSLRLAQAEDVDRLLAWAVAFVDEAVPNDPKPTRSAIEERVQSTSLFVWENGEPVSMAATTRPTTNGITINLVFTPPELRGKGYATACVAALSAKLLASGRRFVSLFADRTNPTSNAIYARIGYQGVCNFETWDVRSEQ